MSLQLRRGNNDDRLGIVFAEGELVYVLDHVDQNVSPLYVGDNSTPGGIPVTNPNPTVEFLNSIGDVAANTPAIGEVLKWDGSNWTNAPDIQGVSLGGSGIVDGSNYAINIIGDDSTVMVDIANKSFTGDNLITNQITDAGGGLTINGDGTLTVKTINKIPYRMHSIITDGTAGEAPSLELYTHRGTLDNPQNAQDLDYISTLKYKSWNGLDDAGKTIASLRAQIFSGATDDAPLSSFQILVGAGGTSYKQFSFAGDGSFESMGAVKVGSYDNDADRDAGVAFPQEGHIIFNRRDDSTGVPCFQGYDGTAWVDLH